MDQSETVAVLDFETTGMSPALGARPTEIAIALVRSGAIVDRFQSLMNPGCRIPAEITALTGITNAMVAKAPPVAEVMQQAAHFVGTHCLVAHNAAFDSKFWLAELPRTPAGAHWPDFACTVLLSRRLQPEQRSHRLGALAQALGLPITGRAHRAMVDVEMTCHLWLHLQARARRLAGVDAITHAMLTEVQRVPRQRTAAMLQALALALGPGAAHPTVTAG